MQLSRRASVLGVVLLTIVLSHPLRYWKNVVTSRFRYPAGEELRPSDRAKPGKELAIRRFDETVTSIRADRHLIVCKSEHEMRLYENGIQSKSYRIDLGLNPVDDKEVEGDARTPEGTFYICTKNPNSKYYLSLGLSYPDAEDATRGLEQGLIGYVDAYRIKTAITRGRCPPWNTFLGGMMMIHGHGTGGLMKDWTGGCIALSNDEMTWLYHRVQLGDPVTVFW